MSSRILSTSGAAAISAVTPPDLVATFALNPVSSSRVTSATLPNSIVSSHGAMSAGSTPASGSATDRRGPDKVRATGPGRVRGTGPDKVPATGPDTPAAA